MSSVITTKIILRLFNEGSAFTIDDIFNFFKKDEQRDVKIAIARLKYEESIKRKQNYEGSVLISLSEKGKLRALNMIFKKFDNRKERWDGKWRMVSFDIPDVCAKGRKALAYRLRAGGFYKIQESLFLYPYNCEKEIKALARLFKIEKYICFGLLESIDDQDKLIHHFKLG
ncbi:MAG: hypothetical protein A2528_00275 [Candidatus Staskawiczbacteria bacterium RIFOXYD2_FULL_37_9]|uniref:Transcriptional repressor PaaX-like central Cas2-like domain-containing protein n=1 Tax=Candidatus Staskawiczbacteria bacterium RIFOXYB1_FULL_37_44 TaxID=1802223 RepID=A0A1G2IW05_9BACT|nr:MAG: hypothetical protein A2358_01175 [Candidatus Staskawiczbacteria bacterium RIFOXYB1_FULL_37_44]OGZ84243.1 MAG: hypothetical protein A2416_02775 [Candidatus Staskawiczbacteria bacterium RIFOXYC1_FULL_37_52]OGZ87227.1 MAG: hypothetical protein A2444_03285 [Candidatus Staskawiczbacteria bacterium RIFOXYC2_FULL_37_19]OGZ89736.1 MAG: hypothetical protein A2581_01115 [Candidatus Staskawiczbacteria bacterium RIFOXYD1_FULL_37_110]OGZ92761.1 MAG: hypothetical protein A2528_00275 [Candidatus Stask